MKHRLILASASILALAAAIVPGCGDHVADTAMNPLTPGAGGSANTGNQVGSAGAGGGAPAAAGSGAATPGAGGSEGTPPVQLGSAGTTGATSPAAQGGSGGMTGAAGAAAGGAAGAGGAPPASTLLCPSSPSPSNGVTCTVTCTDPCGVQNLGTRVCTCTNAMFACATCTFTVQSPLLTPPTTPLPPCPLADDAQEDDGTGCTDNDRCQSIGRTAGGTDGANRFCGCLSNEWDCDTKPASFGG